MIATPQEILAAGLQCTERERLAIANGLLESVSDDIDDLDEDELLEELKRRSVDREGAVSWDVIKAESLR